MTAILLGILAPSLFVSWAACYVVRRWAPRWRLVDHPGHRKVHTTPTPRGGGLAIWLGVVLPLVLGQLALWLLMSGREHKWAWVESAPLPYLIETHLAGLQEQSRHLWFLLGAGTLLMLLGLADDLRGLDWKLRLAVQTVVALLVVWYGWRITLFVSLPWLTAIVTVLWIVGLVNSFNMLDNMDGLAGGVASIASAMLAGVLLVAPDPETGKAQLFVVGLLVVLVGALLGFLWHNRPPARLFMGDAGSYFIGFLLAVTTILATFTGGRLPKHAILAPLCVLAVPLYDTITVVLIRLRSGRSPFEGDKNHFSHRLVDLGMSKGQAVLTIYLTTATCGWGAFLLHQVDWIGAIIIMATVVSVLALIAVLETTARRQRRK